MDGSPQPNPIPAASDSTGREGQGASEGATSAPDWISYIPEEHRSNPKAYFDQIDEMRAWSEYGRKISPFHRQFESFQSDYQAFEAWRKSQTPGQTPAPSQPTQPAQADDDDDVDYTDPEAVRRALRHLKQQMQGYVEQFGQQMTSLSSEQKTGQDTLYELLRIQQELRDLQNEEFYSHAKFKPTVNPQELAKWMLENGVNDARRAHELLYGKPSLEARVKQAEAQAQEMYNKGRGDMERELAGRRVSTETSSGTPWRLRPEGRSPHAAHSMERGQEILDKAADKAGLPREPYMRKPEGDSVDGVYCDRISD